MRLEIINPYYKNLKKLEMLRSMRSAATGDYRELVPAVTDRTEEDVKKVKEYRLRGWTNLSEAEKAEWLQGMKGSLNVEDINRIEYNIQLLSDVLELNLTTKQFSITDIPNESDYARIQNNVMAVRQAYVVHADTPNAPQIPLNSYRKINDLEKILLDVYEILKNNFFHYAGEIYAGDEIGAVL